MQNHPNFVNQSQKHQHNKATGSDENISAATLITVTNGFADDRLDFEWRQIYSVDMFKKSVNKKTFMQYYIQKRWYEIRLIYEIETMKQNLKILEQH